MSKRFSRVRPFIDIRTLSLGIKMAESNPEVLSSFASELYFSSGRAALKWLLIHLRKINKRPLNIGMQAFTCNVVLKAVQESGNVAIFFDIDSNLLTTRIDMIDFENIDVLILTQLFGLPNPDYFEICELCKKHDIFLIDDLAQTVGAEIDGKTIGEHSNFAIYSFGFDKPISCYKGGLLKINDHNYLDYLNHYYAELNQERKEKEINDLIRLQFYYSLFDPECYRLGLPFETFYDNLFLWLPHNVKISLNFITLIIKFSKFRPLNYLPKLYWLFLKNEPIHIEKLGRIKIWYIKNIWKMYGEIKKNRCKAAKKAITNLRFFFPNLKFPHLPENIHPAWHRLPVLAPEDTRMQVITWGIEKNIEIGAFNWNQLVFDTGNQSNLTQEKFPGSYKVVREILNIPIWTDQIWD